ncbi:MAG: tetratricopeptide repeat protein [Amphiplicatus sp.]
MAQAEAELRRNLVLTPRKAVLYDALASLLIRQNRIEEAEPIVERLEALSSAGGAVRRVQLLLRCGEYDAALNGAKAAPEGSPVFAAFLAFGPHSAAARRERADVVTANALIAGGRALIDADDRAIRRAIETLRKSDEPAALALAGELALAIDDDDGARGFFDRALKAFPDLSAALVGRLRVDVRADDFAAAEGWLKGIIERDTDNLAALTALARVLVAQGRLDEARERLRPVSGNLAASPDDARLFAALLLSRGEVDALGAFADEARRLRPADPETAALFAEAGRFAEAAHVARAALLEAPSEERRALYRAQMERQGRAAEAAAFLKALAARTGDDAGFSPQAPRKAAGESVREARIAYLTAPGDPAAASRFGAALAASGNEEGASRVLREASFWALEEKYLSRAGKS